MRRSMESSSDPARAARLYVALKFFLALPAWVVVAVYLVRVAKLDPLELVLVGTVMEAAVFICEVPTGVVADLVSRRLSLGIGWLVQGGAWALVAATTNIGVILAAWVLWGVGATFESGAFQAWVTDEVGADRVGRVFVRGSQAAMAGGIIGVAAGFAIATVSLRAAIYGAGAVTAATGIVALALLPETGFMPTPRGDRSRRRAMFDTAARGARVVRAAPTVVLLLLAAAFAGAASEGFDRLREAHLLRDIGVPTFLGSDPLWWFAVLSLGGIALGLVGANLLLPHVEAPEPSMVARVLLGLTLLEVCAGLMFALAGAFALAVAALWLLGLARTLVYPLYSTWLNQSIDDSSVRATVNSFASQADAVGQTAGGPVIGALGRLISLPAALVASALFLSPALAFYSRAGRSTDLADTLEARA
jgi:MFS transporter, DHA3 family, tetracycline resistance protein